MPDPLSRRPKWVKWVKHLTLHTVRPVSLIMDVAAFPLQSAEFRRIADGILFLRMLPIPQYPHGYDLSQLRCHYQDVYISCIVKWIFKLISLDMLHPRHKLIVMQDLGSLLCFKRYDNKASSVILGLSRHFRIKRREILANSYFSWFKNNYFLIRSTSALNPFIGQTESGPAVSAEGSCTHRLCVQNPYHVSGYIS